MELNEIWYYDSVKKDSLEIKPSIDNDLANSKIEPTSLNDYPIEIFDSYGYSSFCIPWSRGILMKLMKKKWLYVAN